MKKMFLLILSLFFILSLSATAQEGQEMNEEMQAWMEYMTPGDAHKQLAKEEGEWKLKAKMWMDPNQEEPMLAEGEAESEMILGGRYLETEIEMPMPMMGMEMEGLSITGYDNALQKYTQVWMDNFGTGISTSEGEWNEDENAIVYHGTYINPVTGEPAKFKQIVREVDEKHSVLEMYDYKDGKEYKSMEIEMKRD